MLIINIRNHGIVARSSAALLVQMQYDAGQEQQQQKYLHARTALPYGFVLCFGEHHHKPRRADVSLHNIHTPLWTLLFDSLKRVIGQSVVVCQNDCFVVTCKHTTPAICDLQDGVNHVDGLFHTAAMALV
jgi:hypothetical protein